MELWGGKKIGGKQLHMQNLTQLEMNLPSQVEEWK